MRKWVWVAVVALCCRANAEAVGEPGVGVGARAVYALSFGGVSLTQVVEVVGVSGETARVRTSTFQGKVPLGAPWEREVALGAVWEAPAGARVERLGVEVMEVEGGQVECERLEVTRPDRVVLQVWRDPAVPGVFHGGVRQVERSSPGDPVRMRLERWSN